MECIIQGIKRVVHVQISMTYLLTPECLSNFDCECQKCCRLKTPNKKNNLGRNKYNFQKSNKRKTLNLGYFI